VKLHRVLILLASLTFSPLAFAQTNPKGVAEINGQFITQEELNQAAADELKGLETKRLQNDAAMAQDKQNIMDKALEELVANKLIEAEAKKQNITPEKLLENEVDKRVQPPSEAAADAFYEANKARIPVPKEQAMPQVMEYLMERNRAQTHDAFVAQLKKQYGFKSYLEPLRIKIDTAGHPSRGADSAPITIVEFSDFECPFCGGLFPTLKQIEKDYGDKLRIVYREFPLTSIHPHAEKAAEAALCAFEQQHFWEFHDSMFGNQKELSIADLKQRAADMKLNTEKFNECIDSSRKVEAIQKDVQDGARAGVTGTPAMFINGRFLSGNQPYQTIKDLIEDELQRKQAAK
jgi:protein-disulfide isomerase/Skp family chaperone for outer membrane proteins